MSVVTSLCILADHVDCGIELEKLGFRSVGANAGGNKFPQAEVWMTAINYLQTDTLFASTDNADGEENLLKALQRLEWPQYGCTQVFINREDEAGWTLLWELKRPQ